MFFKIKPIVSVCIPVFNTENTLERCLNSVKLQNSPPLEVVIVDDGSTGSDKNGRNAACIASEFSKKSRIPVKVIKNSENTGLLEARRKLVLESKGKYILMLDSDDVLEEDCLKVLFETAEAENADIVHGQGNVYYSGVFDEVFHKKQKAAEHVYEGILEGKAIEEGFLCKKNHSYFMWGKLFLRETYLNCLENIPPAFCVMEEDFLQYFFMVQNAKKYAGINKKVYGYYLDEGISSRKKIQTLETWEKVCSASSAFTIILDYMENQQPQKFSAEVKNSIKLFCRNVLKDTLRQKEKCLAPELKEKGEELIELYWGKDFVMAVNEEVQGEVQ